MNTSQAVDSLAALAQQTRLDIFRLLVRYAPLGLPAGAIARHLRLPGPTLSFHLNVLAAARLVEPHKNGRSIRYSPRLEAVNSLAGFLMENCCSGRGSNPRSSGQNEPACRPDSPARSRKQPRARRP
jgi:ArsR family transcriptional regulator, arsenate/arsenite/antimonite-responsive transcriptional repressor